VAVLCEAISVIIRKSSIVDRFEGGFDTFLKLVPNDTLCDDGELIRVGFMSPDNVESYIGKLVEFNLRFHRTSVSGLENVADIAVVDQQRGLTNDCEWLLVGRIPINSKGDAVTGCWLAGSIINKLFFPDDWTFENSLSQKFHFSETENVDSEMKFLRTEGNLDVYLNVKLGIEVFTPKRSP
jgi:hypothetical protein